MSTTRRFRVTGIVPTAITMIQWGMVPILTLSVLLTLIKIKGIPFEGQYTALAVISFLLSSLIFREHELIQSWRYEGSRAQIVGFLNSWFWFVVILIGIGYLSGYANYFHRLLLAAWFLLTPPLILLGHYIILQIQQKILNNEENVRSVVIAGINEQGRQLARSINNNIHLGMRLKGFFEDRHAGRVGSLERSVLLGRLEELPAYVQAHTIDVIYISLPMIHEKRILGLLDELRDTTASIYFVPDIFISDLIQSRIDSINGIPALAVCETPFYGIDGMVKRISDLVLATLIVILISPLLLAIAIGVKLSSKGPVIFKQRRYGLDGAEIRVYKFRSMTVCEDSDQVSQATKDDQRVTPLGKFLRRTSLDELPQFINVLQGRMSIVGPRPHAVAHNEMYRKLIKGYMVRHKVRPGITGWAQVNGLRGETETLEKMKERIEFDLDYLRNWSFALDMKIILKTIWVSVKGMNAY